ncbi:MAG: hypothetical protein H6721_33640 [Sandaracinus sp.]|nr:hypothetical protein [Sandaracinus sp.]MCB9631468.1 hypothetical protein [Sandaracinus sp.]MCB9637079.1 hypothetical protein [Sandaracinus sp.]
MPYVALTALGLGLLAPFLRAWIWGVPLALFSTAMLLRAFLGEFLVAFFAGGVLLVALPPPIAAAVGGGVTLLLSSLSARRNRHLRALALVAYRLGQADARDEARVALLEKLAKLRRSVPPKEHAEYALFAALPLSAVELWADARTVLETIAMNALAPEGRARALQALATVRLQASDLEGASEAFAAIARPAEPAVERWVRAGEALLFAVQGAADEALALCPDENDADGALAATYDVVRAHAHASRDEEAEAVRALQRVKHVAGNPGLRRAIGPVGPATDLARAMLAPDVAATENEAADA